MWGLGDMIAPLVGCTRNFSEEKGIAEREEREIGESRGERLGVPSPKQGAD